MRRPRPLVSAVRTRWLWVHPAGRGSAKMMRRWHCLLLVHAVQSLVADPAATLYLPREPSKEELTTYRAAWVRRLPRLEDIPTTYFAGLAQSLEREYAPGEETPKKGRRRRLALKDEFDSPGFILLLLFTPVLFTLLFYAQGCCRPRQVVPT